MGDLSVETDLFSSPPTGVQIRTTMRTPKTRKNRSAVWNDFTLDPEAEKIAICGKRLKYNGTSSMTAHLKVCKSNPNNESNKRRRTNASSATVEGQVLSSPLVPRFDQEKLRCLLVKMFVGMELPFNKVEHPDFQEFVNGLNPKFNLISRTTLACDTCLYQVFAEYSGVVQGSESGSSSGRLGGKEDLYNYNRFLESTGSSSAQTDLQKYLDESLESQLPNDFDVLKWWKGNSSRLPILAKMAKDLFAIPISTVPSESTFSLGGRVIDEHRSCLTPQMVEALICSYSCIKGSRKSSIIDSLIMKDYMQLEKLEEEIASMKGGDACSIPVALDED